MVQLEKPGFDTAAFPASAGLGEESSNWPPEILLKLKSPPHEQGLHRGSSTSISSFLHRGSSISSSSTTHGASYCTEDLPSQSSRHGASYCTEDLPF